MKCEDTCVKLSSVRESIDLPLIPASRIVLLVDDAELAGKMMARLFQSLGHKLEFAVDGLTGIQQALAIQPDIILLDLQLPDMHGCEVAQILRTVHGMTETLIVALTGSSDEASRVAATAAGVDEFLVKPVSGEALERLLQHPKLAADS